jgi:hypothetical protein
MKSFVYLIRLYFSTSYKKTALHVFLFSPFLSLSSYSYYLLVMLLSVNSSAIRISILLLVLLRQSLGDALARPV